MRSSNIRYVPQLDHLRALAVTILVFYHGLALLIYFFKAGTRGVYHTQWLLTKNPFLAVLVEGHTSVALFMVLSGFIFTYGVGDREIVYQKFLANRMWRIYPMLLFFMLLSAHLNPGSFTFLGFVQSLLFLGNMPGAMIQSNVGWAIGVEFQFYLLFPFLLVFQKRFGFRYLVALVALTTIGRGMIQLETNAVREASYLSILGRLDQFVIGMAAALILQRATIDSPSRRWLRRALPLAVAAVLGWFLYFHLDGGYQTDKPARVFWPTIDGLVWGALVVTYVAWDDGAGVARNWLSLWVARLGEISFSCYLLHLFLFQIVQQKKWLITFSTNAGTNALLNTLVIVWPATIALGTLTYLVIEKPFMSFRSRYLRDPAVSADRAVV